MKFALVAFFTTTSVLSLLLAYYGVVGRKGDRGQKASASLALLLGVFAALWSALGIAGALRKLMFRTLNFYSTILPVWLLVLF
jgi:hypothetical protein